MDFEETLVGIDHDLALEELRVLRCKAFMQVLDLEGGDIWDLHAVARLELIEIHAQVQFAQEIFRGVEALGHQLKQ